MEKQENRCQHFRDDILKDWNLILVSNRGPFSIQRDESGEVATQRSGGGLVTALLSLAKQVKSTWIASAISDEERNWTGGDIAIGDSDQNIKVKFVCPDPQSYDQYYQVISNPLLWFLQHLMWDYSYAPTINRSTWDAWDNGYRKVNSIFADAIVEEVRKESRPSIIMFQDYHLYLAPRFVRQKLRRKKGSLLTHFIHIPWPGPEDWGLLPGRMRQMILDGLCAVDLIGFQTHEDALNFIRTCESLLPDAHVNYRSGRVVLHNHVTHVRDFPISIDVKELREQVESEEVALYSSLLETQFGERKLILRIDRTEPSKNIVRGFQAYEELLEYHPEHRQKVQFLAILVPSRLDVEEYQGYLNDIMAAAGQVNAKYGTSDWEPVRVLVGESYPRAIAAMLMYDVLLVNPVADGMNLVSKEGPIVNRRNGVLVLSERAGVHQQLGKHALVISPCDVSATAEALHMALEMPMEERKTRSDNLRKAIEKEDIYLWLCWQLDMIEAMTVERERKEVAL